MPITPSPRPIQNGRMDNLTRRSGSDALQGHWAMVDTSYPGVSAAFAAAGSTVVAGRKLPCIFMEPATIDPTTGIPIDAVIRMDGTTLRVTVPYDALTASLPT